MNERKAAIGVAKAEADFQMSRPFARGVTHVMNSAQQAAVRALIYNGIVAAIEAWEKGRASRESAAFYEGRSDPLVVESHSGSPAVAGSVE